MKTPRPLHLTPHAHPWFALAAGLLLAPALIAAEPPNPGVTPTETLPADSKVLHRWPGGVDPRPTVLSISRPDAQVDQLLIQWMGLNGPFQVVQGSDVAGGNWSPIGTPTMDLSTTIPAPANDDHVFFRIEGPRPDYIGGSICRGCHPTAHDGWEDTAHNHALDTLKAIGQAGNSRCLPCHTVGYGLPGGFVSEATTPRLAGVQCENCHGPGGAHVADPGNLLLRPVVSQASMTCGGCHSGFHHPTYDEWLTSGHNGVYSGLVNDFQNPNVATAEARMKACGACHSGAVRLAMLNGAQKGDEFPAMPSGDHAAHTGITCAVCHTAHEKTPHPAQLRNPEYSLEFFSYSTSTNSNFARQYKPDINLCGQCHNQRGARWQDTARPPHHSPQYNVLIGEIGFMIGTPVNSTHRDIAKQCTHCHTHGHGLDNPSEEDSHFTGHTFQPVAENCAPCHTESEAEAFVSFTQRDTRAKIQEVKTLLDTWGETKAPEPLRTTYGRFTWEFNNIGQISQPVPPGTRGPSSAEQGLIPDTIKQARFFLYMVEHDGSYGVHNGRYARHVLAEARKLVETELAAP